MQFPVMLCERNTLIVIGRDFFNDIGHIDEASARIEIGVTKTGLSELNWILDCEGHFHELKDAGLGKNGILERLGIIRRRQKLDIAPAENCTAEKLLRLISGLQNPAPEVPNVTDLTRLLKKLPPQQVLNRENLRKFFGE